MQDSASQAVEVSHTAELCVCVVAMPYSCMADAEGTVHDACTEIVMRFAETVLAQSIRSCPCRCRTSPLKLYNPVQDACT